MPGVLLICHFETSGSHNCLQLKKLMVWPNPRGTV